MHKTNSMTILGGNTSFSVNPPSSEAGPKDSGGDHLLLNDNRIFEPSANQDTTIINDLGLTYHHKKKALIHTHNKFFIELFPQTDPVLIPAAELLLLTKEVQ